MGTPGSTFLGNVRHYHLNRFGHDNFTRTFYQQRHEMEMEMEKEMGKLQHQTPLMVKPANPKRVFDDIVLAISFSFPHYFNIPILKWIYQVFPYIHFCGPLTPEEEKYRSDVHVLALENGWFQYRCLLSAIDKYPGKRGYLGSNDDLIINWWQVEQFDFDKVWLEPCKRFANISKSGLIRNVFEPNVLEDGLGDPFPHGKAALLRAYMNTSQAYREKLTAYTGGVDVYCEGDPDFIYLPLQVANEFSQVVKPFNDANVSFIYIYHSVVRGIVSDNDIVKPNGVWMWGVPQRKQWAQLYKETSTICHPLKLTNGGVRNTVISIFQKHLPSSQPAPPNPRFL